MSATIAQSVAWDNASPAQKAALATQLHAGQHYQLDTPWAKFVARCLNPETRQFRIVKVWPGDGVTAEEYDGWLVTLHPELQARLTPCQPPEK